MSLWQKLQRCCQLLPWLLLGAAVGAAIAMLWQVRKRQCKCQCCANAAWMLLILLQRLRRFVY